MEKQLTIPGFPTKEKYKVLSLPQKANIVYWTIIDRMPNLYDYIMKGGSNGIK